MTENNKNPLPRLSRRLQAAADLVTPGYALTDVGCDHAHIPIWLMKQGLVPSVLAMDCIPGPLQKAAENLALYGMEEKVMLRLSDGLDAYRPGEGRCLMITGLGGRLMAEILLREPDKTRDFEECVLEPQSEPWLVRRALRGLSFGIDREVMVEEDGKFYPVIHAVRDREGLRPDWKEGNDPEACLEAEDRFGPCLIREKDPVLLAFLLHSRKVREKILSSLARAADSEKAKERAGEAGHILSLISMILSQFGEEEQGSSRIPHKDFIFN